MDAPRQWWTFFTSFLCTLGLKQSQLHPCIFYWYHGGHFHGVIALHVDDMMIAGTTDFEKVLTRLRERHPFKHWKEKKGDFLGRQIRQNDVFLLKEAANWIVGTTRPDIAADTALLQEKLSSATICDLIEANKLVAKMKDFSHVRILIKRIPLNEAIVLATSDPSWSNAEPLGSQAGYMVLLAHQDLRDGSLRWKSYKLKRRTQSTLGAQLMSACTALAEANWIRSLFTEAPKEKYDLKVDREFRGQLPLTLAVDNKPVYDHIHGDGIVVKDKR